MSESLFYVVTGGMAMTTANIRVALQLLLQIVGVPYSVR